jgi:hypothetical protein
MNEGIPAVRSLGEDLLAAVLAHILLSYVKRRFSDRGSGTTGSDDSPLASSRPPDVPVRARTRVASGKLNMTPEQAADLIERGLPEIMVRSPTLNYVSLTSGCMADRIRNGYA